MPGTDANRDRILGRGRFRLEPCRPVALGNQQRALRTCVLERRSHEPVDQLLEDEFAGDFLEDFDDGCEVELFDGCANRGRTHRQRRGCAWPDKEHTSTFQFCENGAKAVTWEATKKRVTNEFFATHPVSALLEWTEYELENEGRLTHPMTYDRGSDTYQPIAWHEAFARIGEILRGMPDPNMLEFYTSGRASNEAAFLYQLFGREYGTNNFPDCSNVHRHTHPRFRGVRDGLARR